MEVTVLTLPDLRWGLRRFAFARIAGAFKVKHGHLLRLRARDVRPLRPAASRSRTYAAACVRRACEGELVVKCGGVTDGPTTLAMASIAFLGGRLAGSASAVHAWY